MRPSCNREAEVGVGKAQLPQRSANVSKLSRRHTKLEKRRPEVDAPRQPNHQPQWKEATVRQAHAEEEGNRAPQPGWNLNQLDQMTVPAFSPVHTSNNDSAINS